MNWKEKTKIKVKASEVIYIGDTDNDLIYGRKYKVLEYAFRGDYLVTIKERKLNNNTSILDDKWVDKTKFVFLDEFRNMKIDKILK